METPLHWPPAKSPGRSRRVSPGQSCPSGCQRQSYVLHHRCQFLPEGSGEEREAGGGKKDGRRGKVEEGREKRRELACYNQLSNTNL